jgi:trimeric autotransporter adhesin
MTKLKSLLLVALITFAAASSMSPAQAQTSAVVPRLVNFAGKAVDEQGRTISGSAGATFAIYREQTGGEPLWIETQTVTADTRGSFIAQLGATNSAGLPPDLFASGEARWLGVRINGGEERPRVMLLSVPYALKAGDAATVGGLPPSAFVLAAPPTGGQIAAAGSASASASASVAPSPSSDVTTAGGTVDTLPLWTTATNVQSSALTQTGTGATAKIGIGVTAPVATLDVKGSTLVRGNLGLASTGNATAAAGKNSQPQTFTASAFNSGTSAPVNQNLRWQAEPAGNNASTPSATLNFLYGAGTATPAETGLKIASNGQITFAPGQTFPGGGGTIAGVTAGTDLTGGGSSGSVTLNLDTTKVPQLAAANTFTGSQTINGNLSATGVITGSGFQIGSSLFDYGSAVQGNAFLGFAGNTATVSEAIFNTGVGYTALASNTSGGGNTASGAAALNANTTGAGNTADGVKALYSNTTGVSNTAVGSLALLNNTAGLGNTAVGRSALISNTTGNNNTVLGIDSLIDNTTGSDNIAIGDTVLGFNGTGGQNIAIGTAALQSSETGFQNTATGYQALYKSTGSSNSAYGAQAFHSLGSGNENTAVGFESFYSVTSGNDLTCIGYDCTTTANGLSNATAIGAHARVGTSNSLVLGGTGQYAVKVGIGTATPTNVFTIAQGAGHPVSDSWETYSSLRWKTNIRTLPDALAKVEKLRGVSYDLKDSGKHEIGVIAEEVGAVVPELVSYEPNGKDARSVDYARLTALLIEATKQQQREIRQQRELLKAQAEVAAWQARAMRQQQSALSEQQAAIRELKSQLRETRQTLEKIRTQASGGTSPTLVAGR